MNAAPAQQRVFATPGALARAAADFIVECVAQQPGRFAVCLSGGTTPKPVYELLGSPEFIPRLPWQRIHWFWGDERFVAPDDESSNYGMVRDTLLRHVPAPAANIHPIPTMGASAETCADAYQTVLQDFYGADMFDSGRPLFGLTLLGLGEDGHIASLFPGTTALSERQRWVVAVRGAAAMDRITLTYPALESSRIVVLLAAGAHKRVVLARLGEGDATLPAVHLHPNGARYFFTDRAAAPMAADEIDVPC